jgi:hypothetical protein
MKGDNMNEIATKEKFGFYFWYLSSVQKVTFLQKYGLISKDSTLILNKNTEAEKFVVPWRGSELLLSIIAERSIFQQFFDDIKNHVENDRSFQMDREILANHGMDLYEHWLAQEGLSAG